MQKKLNFLWFFMAVPYALDCVRVHKTQRGQEINILLLRG